MLPHIGPQCRRIFVFGFQGTEYEKVSSLSKAIYAVGRSNVVGKQTNMAKVVRKIMYKVSMDWFQVRLLLVHAHFAFGALGLRSMRFCWILFRRSTASKSLQFSFLSIRFRLLQLPLVPFRITSTPIHQRPYVHARCYRSTSSSTASRCSSRG
jgi:hypothetical protein